MNFIVKYVKTGKITNMTDYELLNVFSKELIGYLVRLKSVKQIAVISDSYGKVLIRKE